MISIRKAVLRDASWVTANLNAQDRAEVYCQIPADTPTAVLAQFLLQGDAFVAYLGDEPVTVFGTTPMTPYCASVWAIGTARIRRTIPAVSAFIMREHIEKRIAEGFRTMEARSLASHVEAHRWMRNLGAEQLGEPFEYGRDGEPFILFRWTVAGYRAIREKHWS